MPHGQLGIVLWAGKQGGSEYLCVQQHEVFHPVGACNMVVEAVPLEISFSSQMDPKIKCLVQWELIFSSYWTLLKKNHQNVLLIFFSLQMIRSLLDRQVLLCFLLHPCYMMLSTFIRLTALLRQGLITVNFSIVADQALQGWAVTSRDGVSLCPWRSPLLSERPRVLGTALPWFKSKGVTMGDRCQAPGVYFEETL